jgi:hypothetical protein
VLAFGCGCAKPDHHRDGLVDSAVISFESPYIASPTVIGITWDFILSSLPPAKSHLKLSIVSSERFHPFNTGDDVGVHGRLR